jgi:hypothetical protein
MSLDEAQKEQVNAVLCIACGGRTVCSRTNACVYGKPPNSICRERGKINSS